MAADNQNDIKNIKVDENNLYKDEVFTDLKLATIRRLSPVKADGSPDDSRDSVFIGQTHIMSPGGPLPIQAEVEAKTLSEAAAAFPEAIRKAVDEMIEEIQQRQRDEARRIVTPDEAAGGGPQISLK